MNLLVKRLKQLFFYLFKYLSICVFVLYLVKIDIIQAKSKDIEHLHKFHKLVVDNFYSKRQNWTTSHLGTVLFKRHRDYGFYPQQVPKKMFHVLLWNYETYFKYRFRKHQYGHTRDASLSNCDVHNCIFYGNNSLVTAVDAVVVPTRGVSVPELQYRNPHQKWIFYTDESPMNSFQGKQLRFTEMADIFNWSMTYRTDSDVPVPFGRAVPLEYPIQLTTLDFIAELVPNWQKKTKTVLVSTVVSNCKVKYRNTIIQEIKKFINVNVYGACGDESLRLQCPGNSKDDCKQLFNYFFYLAFENSLCRQYLTEKVYYNAFTKGAIPIIQGPPLSDCVKLLPPHSFIHIDQYATLKDLVVDIVFISSSKERMLSYHVWRAHFEVTNEGGFFSPDATGFCRVCQALNFNSNRRSVYSVDDLRIFLDPVLLCNNSYNPKLTPENDGRLNMQKISRYNLF